MAEPTENLSPLKQALLQLRELRTRLEAVERVKTEPIAIIGLGLRFPGGAKDPESFWRLLRDGVDTITEVPADRWDINAYYDPDPNAPGKMTTRYGAFLKEIDKFDPHFFSISPREAVSMDPQQRLLLEVCWEALEHAGQSPERLAGTRTGVFMGIANNDYFRMLFADPAQIDAYTSTGNAASVTAGRLSYLLGLHGPNMAVDTACSASLVAAHLAVHSLRSGECQMALAGGVNLILSPEVNINFSKAQGMMAPDGRCKTFDARADGYVRGEGCGVIVLKRLSDALAEGDNILALIRGSAINHDGRSSGLTAPNGPAQEAVIREALTNSGIEPAQVDYIEAHGTGTSLGDPIEVRALGAALGEGRDTDHPLLIGSIKTNIGHLEAAAGIAGLIKLVLALQHGEIPSHLHFQTPNPYIAWDQLPIAIPSQRTAWPARDGRRIAGVSSFGFSGTNAHMILESAPESRRTSQLERDTPPLHLLSLSAKSESVLKTLAAQFADHLEASRDPETAGFAGSGQPERSLAEVCFTANTGRSHFTHRLAVVAESAAQSRERLAAFAAGQTPNGVLHGYAPVGSQPEIVFLFTGQGSQYIGMGRQLYETQPIFRKALEECDALLRPSLSQSLASILYSANSPLNEMAYAQPAIFALEYALVQLWRSWGIEPAAVVGHSIGEYAAACAAGIFSLADGLKLVAARGRLMQSLPDEGEMVTVFADETRVAEALAPFAAEVSIAAINSPETVVISGRRAAVQQVVAKLKAQRIKSRPLPIPQAAHSPLVEPILDEFARVGAGVAYAPPRIALVSSLTGKAVAASEVANPDYWWRHFRETVRFAAAMQTLYNEGYRTFVEIGPNPTLLSLGQRCVPEADQSVWLPSLRQGWNDWQQMLESLGALYVRGAAVDWVGFERNDAHARNRIPLPTYPWERKSYWWTGTRPRPRPGADAPSGLSRSWETAVAAGQQQAQQAPLDLSLSTYPAKWRCLNRLTLAYTVNTLHSLGAFAQSGEAHSVETLLSRFNILPTYWNLMARWLKKLVAEGLLQTQANGLFVRPYGQPLQPISLDLLWQEASPALADLPFLVDYFRRCGDKLTAVLTGAESPLETLFPGGSFETTEHLYQHWAVARYFNTIVRAVVEPVARIPPGGPGGRSDRPVRILEIGAGTGSTTASVLPALPPDRALYYFTDVSDLFLSRAAEKFGSAYPFVRYGLLNIEQAPQAQGYPLHSFDVILAANVLHATPNLDQTLQHVRSLLASDGLFVLFETTTHQSWFDMTTGLIEGWQRFDDELRHAQRNPLLSPAQWEAALRAEGFEAVMAFPQPGSPAEVLGQHVILAKAPSVDASENGEFPIAVFEQTGDDGQSYTASVPEQNASVGELIHQLCEALPAERVEVLVDFVREHVARVLRLDPSDPLDRRSRLMDLGVDSLMAVELRNRLSKGLGLQRSLPATLIFDYPTVEAIANYLATEALTFEPETEAAPSARAEREPTEATADIEQLSDAEVEALLLEKLKAMAR